MVMRGFTGAPTLTPIQMRGLVYDGKIRAPICFNPQAAKTVLPHYEMRTKLGIEGKTPDQRLVEALAAGRAALRDISENLARADMAAFETQGRFIKSRYADDEPVDPAQTH